MKKKLELDDIDVVFDPSPLTEQEKKLISEYIRRDKLKRGKKLSSKQRLAKKRQHAGR